MLGSHPEVPMRALAILPLLMALALPARGDPLLDAMQAELDRSLAGLAEQPDPPYFLAYEVVDSCGVEMHGEDGAFGSYSDSHMRHFDVDVRVGSPDLDNTHPDVEVEDGPLRRTDHVLPVDGDPRSLRMALWKETDRQVRNARFRLEQIHASKVVRVDDEVLADFTPGEPTVWEGGLATLQVDRAAWEENLRRISSPFRDSPVIYDGSARFSARATNRYYVDSEGTSLRMPWTHYRVSIEVATLAPEGTELSLFHAWDAAAPDGLPDLEAMMAKAEQMEQTLIALTEAPEAEPASVPAILSGRASAVFFHEIFGHRMEGHRLRSSDEGQTFADEVGKTILPEFLDVVDDPTIDRLAGVDLNGAYDFDNQGVRAERVVLVEDGVLERFLTCRLPIQGQDRSNGHGRRQSGNTVISRQGNLLVETAAPLTSEGLRARLLAEVEAQGAPYGLYFEDITGGFTYTGRTMANSFNVSPVIVYRIYADGRPDELVRGADLIGTPLATFAQVIAASDQVGVFNGYCGAESGWVPVSAVSPELLVRRIEIQRKESGDERAPILPPPTGTVDGGAR
jgi:TldD protein